MKQLKDRIDEMHAFVSNSTYYEVLGIQINATRDQITKAFRTLAKDWHVDKFSAYDLGEHHRKLQEVFAALNKANQILSTPKSREEYDDELNGNNEAATSISDILKANAAFNQGKNMMRSGAYAGALEKFSAAFENQPENPQYRAYFLYCEYLLSPKNKNGTVANATRTKEIYSELDALSHSTLKEQDWLFVFLGTIATGLGRSKSAFSLFSEALMVNPNNHEAKRQLRLTRMRKGSESKSFLSKLFSKK